MSKATDEVLVWLTENHKNFVPSAKDIKNTDAESSVYAFLTHHLKQKLVLLCKDGRVHFKATGQDTVCKLDQLVNYSKSRSYQRALRKATQKVVDIAKYAPYIVPHSQFPEKVFCIVTRDTLHLDEDEIERHINGDNYIKLRLRNERNRKKKLDRLNPKVINDAELIAIADSDDDEEEFMAGQDYSHLDIDTDPKPKRSRHDISNDDIEGENEEVEMPIVKKTKTDLKTVYKVPVTEKPVLKKKALVKKPLVKAPEKVVSEKIAEKSSKKFDPKSKNTKTAKAKTQSKAAAAPPKKFTKEVPSTQAPVKVHKNNIKRVEALNKKKIDQAAKVVVPVSAKKRLMPTGKNAPPKPKKSKR